MFKKNWFDYVILFGAILVGIIIGTSVMCIMFGNKEQEALKPRLTQWEILEMAISKTESDFDDGAINGSYLGIMQLCPMYVKEVNRILDTVVYHYGDPLDAQKTLEMFNIYQNKKNPEQDFVKAIQLHNPNGGNTYVNKVLKNYHYLAQMEDIREIIYNQRKKGD